MLEHLLDRQFEVTEGTPPGFTPVVDLSVAELAHTRSATADWLTELGAVDPTKPPPEDEFARARAAFVAATGGSASLEDQRKSIMEVKSVQAVQHLTSMLTAYDWEFVEQAKELRGYVVAKVLEETKNSDPRIRLRALDMLGKVAEVGLFEDRVRVINETPTDEALLRRIQERLRKYTSHVEQASVEDAEVRAVAVIPATLPLPDSAEPAEPADDAA